MVSENENFKFWCPLDITKAKNSKGEEVMRLGGIASTMDKDADGEFLDPSGFDIKEFKKSGVVNWHHQAKNSPATIIGEPSKAEVTKKGFYVETDLYPSSELAQEVYALAETFKTDSKSRSLGYSIEGTVIERDVSNPKIVKQAKITGLAITHMPKNAQTFADIIKGLNVDEDEDEKDKVEKELSTASGRAVMPESVDGYKVKNLSQEKMYDKIFDTFPGISIQKAEKCFALINKIQKAMAKGKIIKDEDLEKAMSHLGLENLDENPFLEKGSADTSGAGAIASKIAKDCKGITDAKNNEEANGGDTKQFEKDAVEEDDDEMEKGEMTPDEIAAQVEAEHYADDKEDGSDDEDEDEESEEVEKAEINTILKAIGKTYKQSKSDISALAQIVKAQYDNTEIIKGKLSRTRRELAETNKTLNKALDTIESLSGKSNGRKSLTKAYRERNFNGQQGEQIEKANNVFDAVENKKEVMNILDTVAFAKGYDEEFSKAVTGFEAGNPLSNNVIARLKNEHGITVRQ